MAQIDITTLMQALEMVSKQAIGTPAAQMLAGPGGLFSTCGIEDTVITAHLQAKGLESILPVFPNNYINPIFPYLTGFDSDGRAQPVGVCDRCPGGVLESCNQTATIGRYCFSSPETEINETIKRINRGETTPLSLLGSVLSPGGLVPPAATLSQRDMFNLVTQAQMVTIGVLFQRLLIQQVWQGNPGNNTAGNGYMEFPGLDILISTGKIDAITGTACPALDSDVKDFGYNPVAGLNPSLVVWMSAMERYLFHNASRMGLDPVEWVIVMRPDLWFELTAIWPCAYNTNRCAGVLPTRTIMTYDAREATAERDRLRASMTLPVNGTWYRVILDDGIDEENSASPGSSLPAGDFASSIYWVPLRAAGRPVTFWEHLDYRGTAAELAITQGKNHYWNSDGGRFMWTFEHLNWCFYIQGKLEPRIILLTPHLAGRIQNIVYSPLQHLRSPMPESPYFLKGGREEYPLPSFYSDWNPTGR